MLSDLNQLTGKYLDGIPKDSRLETMQQEGIKQRMRKGLESEEGKLKNEKVRKLLVVAKKLDCSVAQLALAWCLKNPNVSSVITGASKPSQVVENMKALEVLPKLNADIMKNIEDILDNTPEAVQGDFRSM